MLVSLLLILILTLSGLSLTYLFDDDAPLLWRAAAGNVIGAAIFGLVGFVVANLFGLAAPAVALSLLAALAPLALFARKDWRRRGGRDWQSAKGKLQHANYQKFLRFGYYALFFVVFWQFFERAMFETAQGIFTGGSQNFGDLPFHLGAIFSFTEGQNFPPQNPSFAGARFSYPLMADFLSACFVTLGVRVQDALFVQNVAWALALLVILDRFVFRLTGSRLAGKIAPVLLFFSGGLGFLWFFSDFWQQGKGFLDFIYALPRDYTIGDKFRWGNSMVVLFITQRSLLLGMPLTVIVLGFLWKIFSREPDAGQAADVSKLSSIPVAPLTVGLLAGLLPLIHLHSLVVLFVVGAFLLALAPERWRELAAFAVGTAVVAVPELVWAMSGSATQTSEFIAWHFGWDAGKTNVFWFWLKNTGFFIPVLLLGIYLLSAAPPDKITRAEPDRSADSPPKTGKLLKFYVPFAFLFIVANVMKLAPWEWDNIKVLIYWFVGSLPLAALALARLWRQDAVLKLVAAACVLVLTLAGALDVWRTASAQTNYKVFEPDAVRVAEQIRARTAPGALFLNAPTFNTAVVLSGRQSLMRYTGHLLSHGIDFQSREDDLRRIYTGDAVADIFLKKYNIDYVLISPEETNTLTVNERYFQKFPVVAEAGPYKVYKVK